MIGQLGKLRSLPKPNSKAVSEAMSLLTFLGSKNDAGKKLLAEMHDVQEHNESVLKEAQAAISEARKLQEEVVRGRESLERDVQSHNANQRQTAANLSAVRSRLESDKGAFEAERKRISEALAVRATEVGRREEKAFQVEDSLSKRQDELDARESGIRQKESQLTAKEQGLKEKYRRLRAAMDG